MQLICNPAFGFNKDTTLDQFKVSWNSNLRLADINNWELDSRLNSTHRKARSPIVYLCICLPNSTLSTSAITNHWICFPECRSHNHSFATDKEHTIISIHFKIFFKANSIAYPVHYPTTPMIAWEAYVGLFSKTTVKITFSRVTLYRLSLNRKKAVCKRNNILKHH